MTKIYIPRLPPVCILSRTLRDNPFVRNTLIVHKDTPRASARFSWYDPYSIQWVPRDWLRETKSDLVYYFSQ